MSYADQVFISMCEDILENGTSTEGEKVRPNVYFAIGISGGLYEIS